jgi:HAD superfamily hydrolase (TIGR01509 family)
MKPVRAVILDVDGTLVLSNDAHARAFVEAGEELGHPADFAVVRRLIGKGGDKLIPEAFGFEADSEPGERLAARKKEIFRERHLPSLQPAPGARALLERLLRESFTLVVATSAGGDEVGELLDAAGVADLIEEATSSSDAEESKPDPDIVEAALRKTGEPAGAVVMIGDTPYDVEAARRAGVAIVAVRTGGWRDADLAGAAAVYDDPADLLEHLERSPLRTNDGSAESSRSSGTSAG